MNLIKTFSAISGLASVKRYSMLRLGRDESVLEHTAEVIILANILAREVNDRCWNLNLIRAMSIESLTLKAMIHDVDELVVGDIPRVTKYTSVETRSMFRKIESEGVRKVLGEMDLSNDHQACLSSAHEDAKIGTDGLIIAIADCLCVVHRVWEEVLVCGNLSMVKIAEGVQRQLSDLRGRVLSHSVLQPAHDFLTGVLDEALRVMRLAAAKDDPIHGAIREEMVS